MSSPNYRSFQGLLVNCPYSEMVRHLIDSINDTKTNGFKRTSQKHGKTLTFDYLRVDLADTFFHDALDEQTHVKPLLAAAKEHRVRVRLLLLNPFCHQAMHRAAWLEKEDHEETPDLEAGLRIAIRRCWSGVSKILSSSTGFRLAGPDGIKNESDLLSKFQSFLMAAAKAQELSKGGVEVRFTSELVELPFYIVGQWVFKGILSPRVSAKDQPWQIFVDEPSEEEDMYSVLGHCFESAWKEAVGLENVSSSACASTSCVIPLQRPTGNKVLIAYTAINDAALNSVFREITDSKTGYLPLHFNSDATTGGLTFERIEEMLSAACAGVVLALNDEFFPKRQTQGSDDQKDYGKWRSRPNILHEMGLLQGRFGRKRVLVITEEGAPYEGPSNIDGLTVSRVSRQNGKLSAKELKLAILEWLTNLPRLS